MIGDKLLYQYVIELMDGKVVDYYPFSEELPFTEWYGGCIELTPAQDDEDCLVAIYNGVRL